MWPGLPEPAAAWQLNGSAGAVYGGPPVLLHGGCNWTSGHAPGTSALSVGGPCYAWAAHTTSLHFGPTGSFSACVRFKSGTRGIVKSNQYQTMISNC